MSRDFGRGGLNLEGGFEVEERPAAHDLGANLLHEDSPGVNRQLASFGLTPFRTMILFVFAACMLFVSFIMAAVAVGQSNHNHHEYQTFYTEQYEPMQKQMAHLSDHRAPGACLYTSHLPGLYSEKEGGALLGDPLLEFEGHYYQIVGGNWAAFTWADAFMGSWTRCYNGMTGHLATVETKEENAFLLNAMVTNRGYRVHDTAWIGLTDMVKEGDFKWAGNGLLVTTPRGPVDGTFTNWNAGEPSSNGEEDCVVMLENGLWNDDSCYKHHPFYFVEYEKYP